MENIRGMDFTSENLGRKNPFLNGVKFLFPEKAKGPVRWKQSQDACDSSEVHFFFFLRQRKKSDKLILIGRCVRFHFLTEKFILFYSPPPTQHRSFSLLLLLYITLRNKAISKNTCLIIWLWSITLSLRIVSSLAKCGFLYLTPWVLIKFSCWEKTGQK